MTTLEVFFDYACPYCRRGHEILSRLIKQFPEVNIEWHPCEIHPRPESFGLHSDLCVRGMFYAQEQGVDLMEYHHRMYRAAIIDKVDIEDLNIVSKLVDDLMDSTKFYEKLSGDSYVDELLMNNNYAWDIYQFPALPSYRMNEKLLKSIEGIGITRLRLSEFMDENK